MLEAPRNGQPPGKAGTVSIEHALNNPQDTRKISFGPDSKGPRDTRKWLSVSSAAVVLAVLVLYPLSQATLTE